MSDTYIPGFSNALQRYASGGRITADNWDGDPVDMEYARSTKPGLARTMGELAAKAEAGDFTGMTPQEIKWSQSLVQPEYSPEFQGYLGSVNDVLSGLGKADVGQFYNGIPLTRGMGGAGSGITAFNKESNLSRYAKAPAEQNVRYYGTLNGAGFDSPAGSLDVGYDTPMVLVNNRTGEVVARGTGYRDAVNIMNAAKGLTSSDGGKADWSVYTGEPGSTDLSTYKPVMYDMPDQSMLGQFADVALTGLGSALGPLGAMAGSALSSIAQGRSLGKTLKNAAIAGGTTYLGGKLGGVPSGGSGSLGSAADISRGTLDVLRAGGAGMAALPNAAGSLFAALPGAASGLDTLGNALGNIVVTGARSALPAVIGGLGALGTAGAAASGAFGGGGSSAAGGTAGTSTAPSTAPAAPAAPVEPITVTANLGGLTPAQIATAGALGAGGLGAVATSPNAPVSQPSSGVQQQPTQQPNTSVPEYVDTNPIVVSNTPPVLPDILAAGIPATIGAGALSLLQPPALPSTPPSTGAPENVDNNTIQVAGNPSAPVTPGAVGAILGTVGAIPTIGSGALPNVPTATLPSSGTTLKDIADYLRLAGLGTGLLGDLFGGSKSGTAGTIPAGLGGAPNAVFSKALPTANMAAATPRVAQDIDYNRYGYGPEQSFFSNVPQGAKNTSTAFTGYAHGGSAFAVGGPGDGREDKIPAMLSDGEYVMDAETVALLGNGSSKAGAQMLDKFRVNVRKQKGRKLAKGSFSDDAKAPEHYLKGRK